MSIVKENLIGFANKKGCFQILVEIYILFFCGGAVISSSDFYTLAIEWIICVSILCIGILYYRIFDMRLFSGYVTLAIIILVSMMINSDYHGYTLWVEMLIAVFLTMVVPHDIFWKIYERFVFLISCYSMLGYTFALLFPDVVNSFPKFKSSGLINFFFLAYAPGFDMYSVRNYGIFSEPAVFSIYISIAIFYNLVFTEKRKTAHLIILDIALITTKSMTGYVAVFVLYLVVGTNNLIKKRYNAKQLVVFCVGILVSFCCLWKNKIITKLILRFDVFGPSADSVVSRVKSLIFPFYIWKSHPIFGAGLTRSLEEYDLLNSNFAEWSQVGTCWTNMSTYLLASLGIIFFMTFIIGISFSVYEIGRSFGVVLLFAIVMFLLLCGEILTYSPFCFIFMFYGMKSILSIIRKRTKNIWEE